MTDELQLLVRLKHAGYFTRADFDPQLVFQVCRLHLGIDPSTNEGDERLSALISSLASEGLVRFEYSQDPSLHPKDFLDCWRLVLTAAGESALECFTPMSCPKKGGSQIESAEGKNNE